jgi:hypothetical protein
MPLDTSIPLQAQAPQFNPLQMALQAAQFRAYNANGLAAQQQLDANMATSRAYQQSVDPTTGQLDTNRLSVALSKDPSAAMNYAQTMQSVMAARQAQQTYERGAIGLNDDQIKNAENARAYTLKQFGALDPSDPNFASKLLTIGANSVQLGHVDPKIVIASLSNVPDDPQGRAAWLQRSISSLQDPSAQLGSITPKPTQIDNGATKQYVDTNPISNPGIVGTTIKNQLSPESATSPVGVMGPNNTPGVVPRGEMWGGGVSGTGTPQINIPPLPTGANPQGAGQAAPMPGQAPGAGQPHFVATGLPPGASGIADDGAKRVASLQQAAQQAKPLMQTYDLAAQALKGTMAGKGANAALNVPALLNTFGIQASSDAVKNNQLLANYLNSAADQAAASLGLSGSDSRLAAAKAGQPDPNNMNGPALLESINHVKGLQQAVLDRQQATTNFLAQNGNNTSALPQFEAKWNQSFNPDVSYIRSLGSPEDQQAAMQKLKASGHLQQWTKDYQAMKALGAF